MTTVFTINVRNLQQYPVSMWLFLAPPQYAGASPEVYYNSSTYLQLPPANQGHGARFTVPVEYLVQLAQQTQPVQPGIQVTSGASQNVNLDTGYLAQYSSQQGRYPSISEGATSVPPSPNDIVVQTNPFSPMPDYYNAMTFGIETASGFTGVTWEPNPNMDYAITPKLTFYVAVGNYQANVLTPAINSPDMAMCQTGPGGSFDPSNNTWATYTQEGYWQISAFPWNN